MSRGDRIALVSAALLLAAWLFRYQVTPIEGDYAGRFDRWTGTSLIVGEGHPSEDSWLPLLLAFVLGSLAAARRSDANRRAGAKRRAARAGILACVVFGSWHAWMLTPWARGQANSADAAVALLLGLYARSQLDTSHGGDEASAL